MCLFVYVSLSLSLSLYIYVYIYIYTYPCRLSCSLTDSPRGRFPREPRKTDVDDPEQPLKTVLAKRQSSFRRSPRRPRALAPLSQSRLAPRADPQSVHDGPARASLLVLDLGVPGPPGGASLQAISCDDLRSRYQCVRHACVTFNTWLHCDRIMMYA